MLTRIPIFYFYLSSAAQAFSLAPSFTVARSTSTLSHTLNMSNNVGLTDIGAGTESSIPSQSSEDKTTWREKIGISIVKSRKVRGGNYVQIATVDPETLEPRCRTVVFRGFLKKDAEYTDIMKMITDKRSSKYSEVASSSTEQQKSTCEMVWWFGKSSEQYRIRGQLKFVGGDETDSSLLAARKEQWGNLSDPSREQFYWKQPGLPFDSQAEVPVGGRDGDGTVLPAPDNFLLMLLYPSRCDYLRLTDNFKQIDTVNGDDASWEAQRVTP